MTRQARISLALWALLAIAVFAVTFDWNTRLAGFEFAISQTARRAAGIPLETINHGYRPLLRAAAVGSLSWPMVILAAGWGATIAAARREDRRAGALTSRLSTGPGF